MYFPVGIGIKPDFMVAVDQQSRRFGLPAYPLQCNVGQLLLRVAAADVTVHSRKPHLFHVLLQAIRGLAQVSFVPEGGMKCAPFVIDGQRMAPDLHVLHISVL